MGKLKIGWFSSGRGEGSYGLLQHTLQSIDDGTLNASIEYVVCTAYLGQAEGSDNFINLARENNIPVYVLSMVDFTDRIFYEKHMLSMISSHKIDIGVMAGYMLVSHLLHKKIRMLNIHPSLPDGLKGTWKQIVKAIKTQNIKTGGVMVHEVIDDVDNGNPLTFCQYKIDINNIRQQILDIERPLMVETLKILSERDINYQIDLSNKLLYDIKRRTNFTTR